MKQDKKVILMVCDGAFANDGINLLKDFVELTFSEKGYSFIGKGRIDSNLTSMHARIPFDVIGKNPHILVLSIGSIGREEKGAQNSTFKDEYEKIIELIKSKTHAHIVLCSISCLPFNFEDEIYKVLEERNSIIRDISEKQNLFFLDMAKIFKDKQERLINDTEYDVRLCEEPEKLTQKGNLLFCMSIIGSLNKFGLIKEEEQ